MATVMASAMGVLGFLASHPEVLLAISILLFITHLVRYINGNRTLVYFPIVGTLPSLLLNLHRVHAWMTGVMEEKGCTFRIKGPWFSSMNYLFTSDPENVKYITSTNFSNFSKGARLREVLDEFGDNVSTSDSDDWRIRRKLIKDHLHKPEFLQSTPRVIHDKVERDLLPLLSLFAERGGERMVDMREVLQRFTFDVMCLLVLGVDVGSLAATFPVTPFMDAIDHVVQGSFLRFALPRRLWKFLRRLRMGSEKKLSESIGVVDDFIGKFITERKDALSKPTHAGSEGSDAPLFDLLTCLVRHQMEEEPSKFNSDKAIRDFTLELLIAGKYSTSLSLSWFFWMVSTHPSVEARILDELELAVQVDGAMPRRGKRYVVFDVEELNRCVYLNAAIHESLRLFPTIPFAPRWALQHDVLPSGDKVEPGTLVIFSAYSMARMEKVWGKDCQEYKPERWMSSQGKFREESSYKFTGFGAGPRICFGKSLAFAEMRAVAAAVIYNFHFEAAEGRQVSPKTNIVLNLTDGLVGKLRERCPASFHSGC